MSDYHKSVLLKEAIDWLNIKKEGRYIDGTLGGGGHTQRILESGGKVLGIDVDQEAIHYVASSVKRLASSLREKLILARGNFKDIDKIAKQNGFDKVDGILLDLGVSSYQLDTPNRGFSFRFDAPIDMRMDNNLSVLAMDLINGLTKGELYELFTKFGEEVNAHAIVNSIIKSRRVKPIATTMQLAELVKGVAGKKNSRIGIHPATKVFQALRIAVNDELNNLEIALPKAVELLQKDGRLVVLSFHSLEDRIVKNSFEEFEKKNLGEILTKKPIVPTMNEVFENKRSRSVKLRAFLKN